MDVCFNNLQPAFPHLDGLRMGACNSLWPVGFVVCLDLEFGLQVEVVREVGVGEDSIRPPSLRCSGVE